jgi:D-xylose transport system ATP-binding protein
MTQAALQEAVPQPAIAHQGTPFAETHKVWKRFGGVVALRNVDFAVWPGEVVGLVGDNGAGKSTLIKILAGDLQPSAGEIYVNGQQVHFHHPHDAKALKIETIYQDLALCDNLDVADNVFLGREVCSQGFLGILNRRRMYQETQDLLRELGISIPSIDQAAINLSGGQRQATALARVAKIGARLIILDEPTAALGVKETQMVLDLIRRFRVQGIALIVISHEMRDIFDVTDRVVVLKQGSVVANKVTAETTEEEIVRLIIWGRA